MYATTIQHPPEKGLRFITANLYLYWDNLLNNKIIFFYLPINNSCDKSYKLGRICCLVCVYMYIVYDPSSLIFVFLYRDGIFSGNSKKKKTIQNFHISKPNWTIVFTIFTKIGDNLTLNFFATSLLNGRLLYF